MKTSTNAGICRGAAVFLTLAIAGFAGADRSVKFAGSLQGQETDTPQGNPPSALSVSGTVTGVASHIGRFTLEYQVTVSLPAGTSTGTAQLTTPNGDMIFTTIVGRGIQVPDTPSLNSVVEVNTITGGTGRFAGASGQFIVDRLIDLATGLTSGSISGLLTLPGR